ncbi:MAG: hypothetical protein IKK48_05515 [Firmicutes bacterium]|nr:hypothetical protein [Bacillota bacterium]
MVLDREQQKREVREAIEAGTITLGILQEAWSELDSASKFGIADMLGLDFIGGIGKHIKIDSAKKKLDQAQQQAQRFQSELADLGGMLQSCVNIDGAWGFMDFALDGFLVDFFVQDKISKSKNQVQNCINAINRVLEDLHKLEQQL